MKLLILTLSIGIFFAEESIAVSMHSNEFCIGNVDKVEYSFTPTEYSITSGQPWGGIAPEDSNCINIEAGRKSSKDPLNWANGMSDRHYFTGKHQYSNHDGGGFSSLNFAFMLDEITIWSHGLPVYCKSVLIGQADKDLWTIWTELFNTGLMGTSGEIQKYGLSCLAPLNYDINSQKNDSPNDYQATFMPVHGYKTTGFKINGDIEDNVVEFFNQSSEQIQISKLHTIHRFINDITYSGGYTAFGGITYFGEYVSGSQIHIISSRNPNHATVETLKIDMHSNGIEWDANNMVGARTDGGTTPFELSFAVKADLSLSYYGTSYTCPGIYLGQGKTGTKDNWWVFSNNNKHNQTISCSDGDNNQKDLTIEAYDGVSNKFFIY